MALKQGYFSCCKCDQNCKLFECNEGVGNAASVCSTCGHIRRRHQPRAYSVDATGGIHFIIEEAVESREEMKDDRNRASGGNGLAVGHASAHQQCRSAGGGGGRAGPIMGSFLSSAASATSSTAAPRSWGAPYPPPSMPDRMVVTQPASAFRLGKGRGRGGGVVAHVQAASQLQSRFSLLHEEASAQGATFFKFETIMVLPCDVTTIPNSSNKKVVPRLLRLGLVASNVHMRADEDLRVRLHTLFPVLRDVEAGGGGQPGGGGGALYEFVKRAPRSILPTGFGNELYPSVRQADSTCNNSAGTASRRITIHLLVPLPAAYVSSRGADTAVGPDQHMEDAAAADDNDEEEDGEEEEEEEEEADAEEDAEDAGEGQRQARQPHLPVTRRSTSTTTHSSSNGASAAPARREESGAAAARWAPAEQADVPVIPAEDEYGSDWLFTPAPYSFSSAISEGTTQPQQEWAMPQPRCAPDFLPTESGLHSSSSSSSAAQSVRGPLANRDRAGASAVNAVVIDDSIDYGIPHATIEGDFGGDFSIARLILGRLLGTAGRPKRYIRIDPALPKLPQLISAIAGQEDVLAKPIILLRSSDAMFGDSGVDVGGVLRDVCHAAWQELAAVELVPGSGSTRAFQQIGGYLLPTSDLWVGSTYQSWYKGLGRLLQWAALNDLWPPHVHPAMTKFLLNRPIVAADAKDSFGNVTVCGYSPEAATVLSEALVDANINAAGAAAEGGEVEKFHRRQDVYAQARLVQERIRPLQSLQTGFLHGLELLGEEGPMLCDHLIANFHEVDSAAQLLLCFGEASASLAVFPIVRAAVQAMEEPQEVRALTAWITGSSTVPAQPLNLSVTSSALARSRPTARTCSCTLTLAVKQYDRAGRRAVAARRAGLQMTEDLEAAGNDNTALLAEDARLEEFAPADEEERAVHVRAAGALLKDHLLCSIGSAGMEFC